MDWKVQIEAYIESFKSAFGDPIQTGAEGAGAQAESGEKEDDEVSEAPAAEEVQVAGDDAGPTQQAPQEPVPGETPDMGDVEPSKLDYDMFEQAMLEAAQAEGYTIVEDEEFDAQYSAWLMAGGAGAPQKTQESAGVGTNVDGLLQDARKLEMTVGESAAFVEGYLKEWCTTYTGVFSVPSEGIAAEPMAAYSMLMADHMTLLGQVSGGIEQCRDAGAEGATTLAQHRAALELIGNTLQQQEMDVLQAIEGVFQEEIALGAPSVNSGGASGPVAAAAAV